MLFSGVESRVSTCYDEPKVMPDFVNFASFCIEPRNYLLLMLTRDSPDTNAFCLVFVPFWDRKKLKSLMDRLLSFQFLL